jgi:hypothetical protein
MPDNPLLYIVGILYLAVPFILLSIRRRLVEIRDLLRAGALVQSSGPSVPQSLAEQRVEEPSGSPLSQVAAERADRIAVIAGLIIVVGMLLMIVWSVTR